MKVVFNAINMVQRILNPTIIKPLKGFRSECDSLPPDSLGIIHIQPHSRLIENNVLKYHYCFRHCTSSKILQDYVE
jgi:hypothetical protein